MAERHDTFSLEILTPDKPFLVKEATLVVVPSQEGDCGVMAGMAPLLCALRAGVVCIFDEQLNAVERYFVPSGTAWVTGERAVLLVPEIADLARIDPFATKEALLKIKEKDEEKDMETQDSQIAREREVLQQKHYAVNNIPYA